MDDGEMRRLEAVAALGWQAPDQRWLGRWLLRAAEGFTGRANSTLPLGPPDRPLASAVDEVERWYRVRDLQPCIVVPHPLPRPAGDPLEDLLVARGWPRRDGPGIVMTARSADIATPAADVPVDVRAEPDDEWASLYHYRGGTLPPVAWALFRSAPFQRFASVRIDGRVAAIGRVAVAGGWAGITAMEVDPAYRRRGLATAVLAALAGVARAGNVHDLYLQVDETNAAGRALYTAAGFVDRYRYHYRLAR
jgi:ribosomal protein S18 acetylase RimI-like enzyme